MESGFAQVARKVGLSASAVQTIFLEQADIYESARQMYVPRWLGIDEVQLLSFRRTYERDRYQSVTTDVENGRLIELLPDRAGLTVGGFLNSIAAKEEIEVVTMDMYEVYRQAASEVLPWAARVVDKFHVVRMAQNAVEAIRKADQKKLAPQARRKIKQERGLLLQHRKHVDLREILRLAAWLNSMPRLKETYLNTEAFYTIYEAQDKQEATERYDAWEASLTRPQAVIFKKIIRAFTVWRGETLNYWDHRATNAYTEGMNSLLKLRKKQGRGYTFKVIRAIAVYGLVKKELKPEFGEGIRFKGEPDDGWQDMPILEGGQPVSTFARFLRAHGWEE